jgi:hypothetical protein
MANVPSSPIFVTLMMEEALGSFETSVIARAMQRNIPEDGILHSHRCENFNYPANMTSIVHDSILEL